MKETDLIKKETKEVKNIIKIVEIISLKIIIK